MQAQHAQQMLPQYPPGPIRVSAVIDGVKQTREVSVEEATQMLAAQYQYQQHGGFNPAADEWGAAAFTQQQAMYGYPGNHAPIPEPYRSQVGYGMPAYSAEMQQQLLQQQQYEQYQQYQHHVAQQQQQQQQLGEGRTGDAEQSNAHEDQNYAESTGPETPGDKAVRRMEQLLQAKQSSQQQQQQQQQQQLQWQQMQMMQQQYLHQQWQMQQYMHEQSAVGLGMQGELPPQETGETSAPDANAPGDTGEATRSRTRGRKGGRPAVRYSAMTMSN